MRKSAVPSSREYRKIQRLFERLCLRPICSFPPLGVDLPVPAEHGVYVIRKGRKVVHVGRTTRGSSGLRGRLRSHLWGRSSFVRTYYRRRRKLLRENHTFQFLEVEDKRARALLECYAIAVLGPEHLGLGERRKR